MYFILDILFQIKKTLDQNPEQRLSFLSRLLRKFPRWKNGHLAYALENISALKNSSKKDHRKVAALKVSASAALALRTSNDQTTEYEAKFISAMSYFHEKNYEQANKTFAAILNGEQVNFLSDFSYYNAIEYAGLTAMVLEERDLAMKYFSLLPQNKKSQEVLSAESIL